MGGVRVMMWREALLGVLAEERGSAFRKEMQDASRKARVEMSMMRMVISV